MNNEFWINNPAILFRSNKLLDIFINKSNDFNENMNATTRLIFYLTLLVYLINKNMKIFQLCHEHLSLMEVASLDRTNPLDIYRYGYETS